MAEEFNDEKSEKIQNGENETVPEQSAPAEDTNQPLTEAIQEEPASTVNEEPPVDVKPVTDFNTPIEFTKPKKKGKLAISLIAVVAVLALLSGTFFVYGKTIAMAVMGNKNYYLNVEKKELSSVYNYIQKNYKFPSYNTVEMAVNGTTDITRYTAGLKLPIDSKKLQDILDKSEIKLKVGKNVAKKTIAENLVWSYGGDKLVSMNAYINGKTGFVQAPELFSDSIYVNSSDMTGQYAALKPAFDAIEKSFSNTTKQLTGKDFAETYKKIINVYINSIKEEDVQIEKNITVNVGPNSIKCDRITVTFNRAKIQKILEDMVKAAEDDTTLQNFITSTSFGFLPSTSGKSTVSDAVSTYKKTLETMLTDLKKETPQTGKMILNVEGNGLISPKVISRELKLDKDDIQYENYAKNGKGNFNFSVSNSTTTYKAAVEYTDNDSKFSGTANLSEDTGKNKTEIKFDLNKKDRTKLNVPTGTIDITYQGTKVALTLSKNGDATKVAFDLSKSGKSLGKINLSYKISDEVPTIPDLDTSKAINAFKDQEKLNNMMINVMPNVMTIAQKVGINMTDLMGVQ